MIPWIVLFALLAVYSLALPKLLQRAGMNSALGYVPIVNFFPFLKLLKRPWWWFLLLLVPGVNLIMLTILNVELGIAFGKRSTKEQWMFGALPWYAIFSLAFREADVKFVGPREWTTNKKSAGREWGEAIVFAVIAASVIRSFFLEAFTIPTPSMEKSMLVGDYLFVSKVSYGPKLPQTPVSFPFVHNTLPGSMANSYVNWFELPYYRLPGIGKVERYNPVVFNFPNGDTIMVDPFFAGHDYHDFIRREAMRISGSMTEFKKNPDLYFNKARANFEVGKCLSCRGIEGNSGSIEGVRARPVDKKENYVKRCIGLPGENLKIVDRQVYINDQIIANPEHMQFNYDILVSNPAAIKKIYNEIGVNNQDRNQGQRLGDGIVYSGIPLTIAELNRIKGFSDVLDVQVENDSLGASIPLLIYPNSMEMPFAMWSKDNFGPIHIPAKGETIALTPENVILYKRVITAYEGNTWTERDGQIFINEVAATTYTFKQDYYWMMGDNRHQSLDSRFWGFVPEDHLVGKPVFTWFSKSNPQYQEDTSIRWKRMFKFVN
jgi:signal peptidase I